MTPETISQGILLALSTLVWRAILFVAILWFVKFIIETPERAAARLAKARRNAVGHD